MKIIGRQACLAVLVAGAATAVLAAEPQPLPWQREAPLREAARSVALENTLNPTNPLPDSGGFGAGGGMTINNLKMRTTLWGPPDRITISLNKNNVWDRRLNTRSLEAPTLQEITEGAFSPKNKGFEGKAPDCQRPAGYGYLLKEGGFYDGYRQPVEYPMPCMKPVGQIILGIDPLAGAAAPKVTQSCADGVVKLEVVKGDAKASLKYVLGMTSNVYAVHGEFAGIETPVWLRLYRHRDTAHMMYMNAEGTAYTRKGTEADKAFNAPMDPPISGQDGRFFWIRQKFPAEKTFPQGFEYVLMGLVTSPAQVDIETVEGKTKLGTPPPTAAIAAAPGAAATATFKSGADGKLDALVTIVTTQDGPEDLLTLAKRRLAGAEAGGFDGVVKENTRWWDNFYDKRENGRIFHGSAGAQCTDDIRALYRSYTESHGGGTKTDMRDYECSASYGLPERDVQPWTSAPCYNEIFTTNRFVRNWGDSEDMWKQLVWHWMDAGKANAKEMFGMPGMFVTHGYLPPVKADKYVHTTITLELCLETMAQIIKPAWDEWDYGGDLNYLRKECYPLMREMALFYAAYTKKGEDGFYHVIPSMEPERWGFYYEFARNKDVLSSLALMRWGLNRAADAAEVLSVDADLRKQWREVAAHMAPYATWNTPQGPEFTAIAGNEPKHLGGDHFGEAATYPTILADEINLDSPKEQKDLMLRTIQALKGAGTNGQALLLLGQPQNPTDTRRRGSEDAEALCNSRSGRIHLFPVVDEKAEVAFHNFQARGGFLVSAARNVEGVFYVEIQPRRDGACRLMNPWPGKAPVVHEVGKAEAVPMELDKTNGECLVFTAVAGHKYAVEVKK
jgi:hypothetical protein